MLTLTGNGRLTRDVELRTTRSAKSVATISVASDRRDRQRRSDLRRPVLWEGHAEAAAEHLVKGQAVAFSGRFEPRPYQTSYGERPRRPRGPNVALEYGPKARGTEATSPTPLARRPARAPPPTTTSRSEQPCRGPGGVRVDPGPRASSRSTMRYAMNAHQHPPQSTATRPTGSCAATPRLGGTEGAPVGDDPRRARAGDARRQALAAAVPALGQPAPRRGAAARRRVRVHRHPTPDVADADRASSQRERVTESLIRCPAREARASTAPAPAERRRAGRGRVAARR